MKPLDVSINKVFVSGIDRPYFQKVLNSFNRIIDIQRFQFLLDLGFVHS